jgi:hypothetical protein
MANFRHVEDASTFIKKSETDRIRNFKTFEGPHWAFLSEPLQANLMHYLFAVGLRPEIAMAIEYMSWSHEQKLYLAWLRRMHEIFAN